MSFKRAFINYVCLLNGACLLGQTIEVKSVLKPTYFQNECMVAVHKIKNNSSNDIALAMAFRVEDSLGLDANRYRSVLLGDAHMGNGYPLSYIPLPSKGWDLDSSSSYFLVKANSHLDLPILFNDCIGKSCGYMSQIYMLAVENQLPIGKYTYIAEFMCNNGEKKEIRLPFQVIHPSGSYEKEMSTWRQRLRDYLNDKKGLDPFLPENFYSYLDTAHQSKARDRLTTRLPFFIQSKEELSKIIKYLPTIQDDAVLLHLLHKLVKNTEIYWDSRFNEIGVNRLEFYQALTVALAKRGKDVAKAWVSLLYAANARPQRYYSLKDVDRALFLTEEQLDQLSKLCN